MLFVAKFSFAIVSYIDSSKNDFFDVILGYLFGILQDILNGITARDTTSHRDSTVSTFVITTVLNLEESASTVAYRIASYIEISLIDITGMNLPLVELGQVVNILSDVEFFLGTQYQVHPIDSDEVFRLELGIAAYCGYKSIFVVLKRFANNLPELLVCIFRYGTSVNDIDISRFLEIHLVKTFILKTAGNGSRFGKIQLASQGIKSNTFFHKGKRNLGAKIQKNND